MSKDFGFSVLVFNADFSCFSIWFSVFIKNASGFSVLVPDVVFGFSYFFFPIWTYLGSAETPPKVIEECVTNWMPLLLGEFLKVD